LVKVRKDKNDIYTKLLKDKKGISPVITTVILVAVGIALAVAIGLWMSGLVATFTRFEKLEVTSAYAVSTSGGWKAYFKIKNTGSADATISTIMVNGIPYNGNPASSNKATITVNATLPYSLPVGKEATFLLTISTSSGSNWGSGTLTSGITLNVVFHTAAGKDYPASVTLP
jgi:flagellin-like protein